MRLISRLSWVGVKSVLEVGSDHSVVAT
jgi:hypothetical protein